MDREIKFRGLAYTGKWVYGNSIKHTDNAVGNGAEISEVIYIGNKVPNARKVGAMKWIPVDPSTIGQFTGLTDCNGKEIYEGDIVRYYDDIEDCLVSSHVIYHKEFGSFCIAPTELCGDYVGMTAHWQFEVIGNIHDNPSLIPNQHE